MSPRKYDSTRRRAAADETRQAVLEAARSLIGGRGDLDDFSMETVAKRAGVARMTVYHQFGSRAGLLEALADHLASRGGMMRLREAFMESNPEPAVRKFVRTFVGFWASDRVTMRRLRAMAIVFPSEDHGPRDRDSWRLAGASTLLERLETGASPRSGASAQDLAGLIASLTSFETFDALCAEGRTPDQVADLLSDAILRLVKPTARNLNPTAPTDRSPTTRRGPRRPIGRSG